MACSLSLLLCWFWTASTGDSHVQGTPVALAHMAELRGELSFHRHCLEQSPLSHALRDGGELASVVVQFRASIFHVAASALHRLDCHQQAGAGAVCLLCGRF